MISEIKTSLKMGPKLSILGYNIYEEIDVQCANHHISKWGMTVSIPHDLQVSQPVCVSHMSLVGHMAVVDMILGTSDRSSFIHRIIGAYTPWNPGIDDGSFWTQLTKLCCESQHSWTLAGDLNMTTSTVEHPSGGTDAQCSFTKFLIETNRYDLWETQPDCNRERDWNCCARGTTMGGNIID
jgi:hypothetical protein